MSYVPVLRPVATELRYGYPGSWGGGSLDYQYQPWEWPFRPIGRRVRLGFGTTESWLGVLANTNEVYVLRLAVQGAELKDPTDALAFVRAAGRAVADKMSLDVRAVAVKPSDSGVTIDIVLTTSKSGISVVVPSDSALAAEVAGDPELRAIFPKLAVSATLLELTGPAGAVDHWRSQPLLWDHHLGAGQGGPTDTYAEPAEFSVVKGSADDGKLATPWRKLLPPLGDKKDGGGASVATWMLVALGALVVGYGLKRQGDRR